MALDDWYNSVVDFLSHLVTIQSILLDIAANSDYIGQYKPKLAIKVWMGKQVSMRQGVSKGFLFSPKLSLFINSPKPHEVDIHTIGEVKGKNAMSLYLFFFECAICKDLLWTLSSPILLLLPLLSLCNDIFWYSISVLFPGGCLHFLLYRG